MGPDSKNARAAATRCRSSSASRRTTTLVSTAVMTPLHFPANCRLHLSERFGFTFVAQTANDVFQFGLRKRARRAQEDAIAGLFNGEFGAGSPGVRRANG